MAEPNNRNRRGRLDQLSAWAVHLLTAGGVVLALVALDAVRRGSWNEALLWLFAALVIDGVDGTLARRVRIKERLPRIDGEVLDLVIDYLTYVFIPVLLMWWAGLLPERFALPLSALILLSSLYVFARRDMKSDDGYFHGFPALWNLVAVYFLVARPNESIAAGIVLALVAATFAPIHFVHLFRVRDYGPFLLVISGVWAATTAILLVPNLTGAVRDISLGISVATAALLLALGLLRSIRGPRRLNGNLSDDLKGERR